MWIKFLDEQGRTVGETTSDIIPPVGSVVELTDLPGFLAGSYTVDAAPVFRVERKLANLVQLTAVVRVAGSARPELVMEAGHE